MFLNNSEQSDTPSTPHPPTPPPPPSPLPPGKQARSLGVQANGPGQATQIHVLVHVAIQSRSVFAGFVTRVLIPGF